MDILKQYHFSVYTEKFIELNGFKTLTPIQQAVIPMALKKKDIIGISDTGTGKTHSFLIPLMEMIDAKSDKVQAIVTCPTRELAQQLHLRAEVMKKANPDLRISLITGGMDREKMSAKLKVQPHIVIGTPGRIKDLFINQEVLRVDTADVFVVDEADMTLEFGFLDDVDAIAGKMKNNLQMMVFSATIPQALKPFLKKYLNHPQTIKIEDDNAFQPKIEHVLVPCKHKKYEDAVLDVLPGFQPYVCLIFANTREMAAKVATKLRDNNYKVLEMHGDLQARQRKQALKQLQNLEISYIVATDIAARGIDVEGITHVISLGFPSELAFYTHRSGRTGRAGKEGVCFALYQEKDVQTINLLKEKGFSFKHRTCKNGQWTDLKPLGYKRVRKQDEFEKEIVKILSNKKEKVKPGYKKKKNAEVEKLKRKRKRAFIQQEIQAQKKARAATKQREKGEE